MQVALLHGMQLPTLPLPLPVRSLRVLSAVCALPLLSQGCVPRPLLLLLLFPAGVCSVAAVLLGQLPGDWGFFSSYLTGAIVLVVLAVGSTAPGLLQVRLCFFLQLGLLPERLAN